MVDATNGRWNDLGNRDLTVKGFEMRGRQVSFQRRKSDNAWSESVETRKQPIYCPAGHRVLSTELVERCYLCRRKLDAALLRYFRRLSHQILTGAG